MEMVKNALEGPRSTANKPLKYFKCTTCPKSFVKGSSLEEHILNKHLNDKNFQCTECFENKQLVKSFATQSILTKHIKRVHGPPRFQCQVCLKTFIESSNFATHQRIHSQGNIKRHKCGLCPKAYSFNHQLQKHLFFQHNYKAEDLIYFKCEICSQEFFSRPDLELHVVNKHVVDKAFECIVCSQQFIDQETLEKHMKRHDDTEIQYFCDVCPKKFKRKSSLIHHLEVEHKKFFFCDRKCLRSFRNKSEFDEHISDSKQELKCYMCQETINSECDLRIHTDSHVKEIKTETNQVQMENPIDPNDEASKLIIKLESTSTRIQCELCSKTFDREAYFKAHRRLVHQNTEWKCDFKQCFKSFKLYSQLKLHKMKHADTKEFVCNICGKAFFSPYSCRVHKKIHSDDKTFKCETCRKSFAAASQLRVHIANNHGGVKPFKCSVFKCETFWASNNQLKEHLVSHQTERSFQCEMCTTFKAYKSPKQLKYHQKMVHLDGKTNKARKSLKIMENQKHCKAVVFVCSSKMCSFETGSEAEVALHYNEKHHLPKVLIFPPGRSPLPFFHLVQEERGIAFDRMIEKRYKCRICSKLFKFPSLFSQHELSHSVETPFQCSGCPKSFKYKKNLNRHILETHSSRRR